MKQFNKKKKFLEELERTSNISAACNNAGVSRNSIYKWCKLDLEFKKQVEESLIKGVDSINDLAESKLINKIQEGDQKSIRYWLDNNKYAYIRPRDPGFWSNNRMQKITKVQVGLDPEMDKKDKGNYIQFVNFRKDDHDETEEDLAESEFKD